MEIDLIIYIREGVLASFSALDIARITHPAKLELSDEPLRSSLQFIESEEQLNGLVQRLVATEADSPIIISDQFTEDRHGQWYLPPYLRGIVPSTMQQNPQILQSGQSEPMETYDDKYARSRNLDLIDLKACNSYVMRASGTRGHE